MAGFGPLAAGRRRRRRVRHSTCASRAPSKTDLQKGKRPQLDAASDARATAANCAHLDGEGFRSDCGSSGPDYSGVAAEEFPRPTVTREMWV